LADVFLVTPSTGLQDFYVETRYKVSAKSSGPFSYFDGLLVLAQYHEFRSAVQDLDYGSEFDFYAYLPFRNGIYAQLMYANYRADEFFTGIRARLPILMTWKQRSAADCAPDQKQTLETGRSALCQKRCRLSRHARNP
jgi:hypothetical protein